MEERGTRRSTRTLDADALRLLVLLERLGNPMDEVGLVAYLDGEELLQHLDHLLSHPVDLALALLDRYRSRPTLRPRRRAFVRAIRKLTTTAHDARRQQDFATGGWARRDDVLATLACRDLIRVRPLAGKPALRFALTAAGAACLATMDAATRKVAAPFVERCRLVQEHWGPFVGSGFVAQLRGAEARLARARQEEQLAVGAPLLPSLFQLTFDEAP